MILNYDLTFLAMVLSDGAGEMCAKRCAVHPMRRRCCVAGDPALDAAADMSVILTYWQLRDGVADHGFWCGLKYRIASALLYPAYRKGTGTAASVRCGGQGASVGAGGAGTGEMFLLDAPADAFAKAAGTGGGGGQRSGAAAGDSAAAVPSGRWVYLVDAADDLRADIKSGGYNPLPCAYAEGRRAGTGRQ